MKINPKGLMSVLGVMALIAILAWGIQNGREPESDAPAKDTPSATTKTDQGLTRQESAELSRRVREFSLLYFSLSPDKPAQQVREDVEGYATPSFMQQAQFGFGDAEADRAMKREGASIKVKSVSEFVGPINDGVAYGAVTLTMQKLDQEGNVVWTNDRPQEMAWIRQGSTWLVLEAPRT